MLKTKSGFTVVELVIVIAVIGILATIIMVSYKNVQERTRDAQRISDINAIAEAVDLYYTANGDYPMTAGWCTHISNASNGWGAAFQSSIARYMPSVMLDPKFSGTYQDYFYRNVDDQSYYLYAELENSDRSDDGFTGCARIGNTNNEYDYRFPAF